MNLCSCNILQVTNSIKCVGSRLLQTLLALITNVLEQYWCHILLDTNMPAIDFSMRNVSVLRAGLFLFRATAFMWNSILLVPFLSPYIEASNVYKPVMWAGHRNADMMEQWGYLHWLMETIRQPEVGGKESVFHFVFGDRRVGVLCTVRVRGPRVTVTVFLWWPESACHLLEGKSIEVHSLACLLPSRRTETPETLTGSIYTALL